MNDITARITSDELARDVAGAEALLARHSEHRSEMDARADSFKRFLVAGEQIVASGHFMSDEVEDRMRRLSDSRAALEHTWTRRREVYDQSLDLQVGGLRSRRGFGFLAAGQFHARRFQLDRLPDVVSTNFRPTRN